MSKVLMAKQDKAGRWWWKNGGTAWLAVKNLAGARMLALELRCTLVVV